MFTIQQIRPVLQALGKTGAILIGGQAVNLWSERLQKPAKSPWKESRPFASMDVDLLGNQADVRSLAQQLRAGVELPDDPAHTPNVAKIHCPDPEIEIDVLHSANGLNTAEALQTAVQLKYQDIALAVLHPVLCIEAKTANLFTLDQQVFGRQDEKHLRLSIANCREFLCLRAPGRTPEGLLPWAQRLRAHANTHAGLEMQRKHKLRFLHAIPLDAWRRAERALQEWVDNVSPAWEKEVEAKIKATEDIKAWVKTLQAQHSKRKPPSRD